MTFRRLATGTALLVAVGFASVPLAFWTGILPSAMIELDDRIPDAPLERRLARAGSTATSWSARGSAPSTR